MSENSLNMFRLTNEHVDLSMCQYVPANDSWFKSNQKSKICGATCAHMIHSQSCSGVDQPRSPRCCAPEMLWGWGGLVAASIYCKGHEQGASFYISLLLKCIVVYATTLQRPEKKICQELLFTIKIDKRFWNTALTFISSYLSCHSCLCHPNATN